MSCQYQPHSDNGTAVADEVGVAGGGPSASSGRGTGMLVIRGGGTVPALPVLLPPALKGMGGASPTGAVVK